MPGPTDLLPTLLADPALPGDMTKRQAEALKLRISGLTYQQVGERMHVKAQTAHELVKEAVRSVQLPAVTEALLIAHARNDFLWRANARAIKKVGKMLEAATLPEEVATLAPALGQLLARGVDISARLAKATGTDAPEPERVKSPNGHGAAVHADQAAIEKVFSIAGLSVVPTRDLEALKNASALPATAEPAEEDDDA